MSQDDALLRISRSAADAIGNVLQTLCGDALEVGPVAVVADEFSPFEAIPRPALTTSVSYVDGVTGGNVFALTCLGARKLAALMMGMPPDDVTDASAELDELELSAVAESANQMMAAAAAATSAVLGLEVEISTPTTTVVAEEDEIPERREAGAKATVAAFSIAGEPCRLVQFVPHAFVVRVGHAFAEFGEEDDGATAPPGSPGLVPPETLRSVRVRVAAELGRVRLPLGTLIDLHPGTLIELDRLVEEPVDLVVNGRRFATGRLVLDANDEWAVQLETVGSSPHDDEGD